MAESTFSPDRLREAMSGMSNIDLANKLGCARSNISMYLSGERTPSKMTVQLMAICLNVNPAWLAGLDVDKYLRPKQGDLPPYPGIIPIGKGSYVPHYGRIACGAPILAVKELAEVMWMPDGVNADFSLTCVGDSMINARIFDGDAVYLKDQNIVSNGEIAAVIVNDEEVTLKRVYYYPDESRLILRAENPTVKDQVYYKEELNHIKIIGKAVAFLSPVN